MSLFYTMAYWVEFTPWERAAMHPPATRMTPPFSCWRGDRAVEVRSRAGRAGAMSKRRLQVGK
jgi:hypothetical protein